MNLTFRPDIQRFIDDQVKSGRFPTPEALIEAAVDDMRSNGEADLDDETIAAINEAEEQADRGEGEDLDAFRARMTRSFNAK
jgi:Arc/MetJ-type ribon-helix-helix transcriptional regulator